MIIKPYAQYGKDYSPGYTFFTYELKSFISKGIAYFTEGDKDKTIPTFSHCGIVTGVNSVIEASGSFGVIESTIEERIRNPELLICFRKPRLLNAYNRKNVINFANSLVGSSYDFKLIIGFIARKIPFVEHVLDEWNIQSKFICSELVKTVYVKTKIAFDEDVIISPNALFIDPLFQEWKEIKITS